MSKTFIDVSYIERLRWQYTAKNFSSPGTVANPDLRSAKAASLSFKRENPYESQMDTQSTVWSHVDKKIRERGISDKTENYEALISHCMENEGTEFPASKPEKGYNGLAVILDKKVVCIDIFGTEEVFRHYFPKLRDSAFRMAKTGKEINNLDIHEASYKVLDTLDKYETAERHPDSSYSGAGSFNVVESKRLVGFDLNFEGQLIHNVLFSKKLFLFAI